MTLHDILRPRHPVRVGAGHTTIAFGMAIR
jgi:hypothetical protein